MGLRAFTSRGSVATGVAVMAVVMGAGVSQAATVALDNTNGGALALAGTMGSMTATNWNLKVFTVGSSNAIISSMVMGMYSTTVSTYNITWELYAVDGSYNPTGSALATDTQSQSFSTGLSPAYYTFTTGGTLASYSMQAGQTYGLLFKSDAASSTLSWTAPSPANVYSDATSGFTFLSNRRSTNSGSSFGTNSYLNAWQMNVNGASAVPGAGLASLATIGLAGVARRRRR